MVVTDFTVESPPSAPLSYTALTAGAQREETTVGRKVVVYFKIRLLIEYKSILGHSTNSLFHS